MTGSIPISKELIGKIISELGIPSPGKASIREIVHLVNILEKETGLPFIRMEMGVPGINTPDLATEAEVNALRNGIASIYPPIEGIAILKNEVSRFLKLFLNTEIQPEHCIPTAGSMQGAYISFLVLSKAFAEKRYTLFIDPGFPVHKQQCMILGNDYESFDIYKYRGQKLRDKLLSYLETGKVSSILYSNPNNPSWVCLTDEELQIIGELATQYDVIVLEDLAYFGMDFRKDYSQPGVEPYQPTVTKYTDNYILFISTSKVFSYAGQRIGIMAISDKLYPRRFPHLKTCYSSEVIGYNMIYGALYAISAGAVHSAQYGAAALFKAANDGSHNFIEDVKIYGNRANEMKRIFTSHGFKIVYDSDGDLPIADGFYFTISYGSLTGPELLDELIYYGISAITLGITGSSKTEGLRACVSMVSEALFPVLEERLEQFQKDHS